MKKDFITLEQMKYKKNSLPYTLVILGLVFDVFYFFALYKNNSNYYYTIELGATVLYNLIFMLIVFLSAENIKNYHISFSIVVIVIGVLQIARIFYYPLNAFQALNDSGERELLRKDFIKLCVYLCTSGTFLIAGGIISLVKSKLLHNFVTGKINPIKEEEYKIAE